MMRQVIMMILTVMTENRKIKVVGWLGVGDIGCMCLRASATVQ